MGRPLPIGVFAGGLVSRWPNLFSLYLACGPVYIAGRLIGLGATTTATGRVERGLNLNPARREQEIRFPTTETARLALFNKESSVGYGQPLDRGMHSLQVVSSAAVQNINSAMFSRCVLKS